MQLTWLLNSIQTKYLLLFFFICPTLSIGSPVQDIGIDEKVGTSIPLNLTFRNSLNQAVTLRHFFTNKKPILLNLVYFNCPLLCSQTLSSFTDSLKKVTLPIHEKFEVLTISFDPNDTYLHAQDYKKKYVTRLDNPQAKNGWHFLTGSPESIRSLTQAVGFRYTYDTATQEFYHSSALFVLTPDGKLSRYIYGITYDPFNLKLALLAASKKHFISSIDRIILYCYTYDPKANSYTLAAFTLMKIGALITVLIVGLGLFFLFKHDKKKRIKS